MRVVLDTNVIISGLNFPGNERLVLELAFRGRFDVYLSPFILEEVANVLVRKFGWAERRASQAVGTLENMAEIIDPEPMTEVVDGGHADNRILDCAVAAGADYIITGDRRHLLPLREYQGAQILNSPAFLSTLEA